MELILHEINEQCHYTSLARTCEFCEKSPKTGKVDNSRCGQDRTRLAMFAILTIFAKIANFAKNRRKTEKIEKTGLGQENSQKTQKACEKCTVLGASLMKILYHELTYA